MLHLAQVQNQGMSGEVGLRLLARQDAEYMWEPMTEEVIIPTEAIPDASNAHLLSEGLLTLVELSQMGDFKPSRRYQLGTGVDANLPNQWHYTSLTTGAERAENGGKL